MAKEKEDPFLGTKFGAKVGGSFGAAQGLLGGALLGNAAVPLLGPKASALRKLLLMASTTGLSGLTGGIEGGVGGAAVGGGVDLIRALMRD